jgi:hypothetical protein
MWHLKMRGNEIRTWTDLGSVESISAAALHVLKLERDHHTEPTATLFFRVYADPLMEESDAEILCRLEYQGVQGFYLLTREMQ